MKPTARYQEIREQTEKFTNKYILRNLIIRHINEAIIDAYEDAAKIAERHHGHEGIGHQENGFTECLIAEEIRARAKEVGK